MDLLDVTRLRREQIIQWQTIRIIHTKINLNKHVNILKTTKAGTVARGRGFEPVPRINITVYNNTDHFCPTMFFQQYLLDALATIVIGYKTCSVIFSFTDQVTVIVIL